MTASLGVPISPITTNVGDTGHAAKHTEERNYLETIRQYIASINPSSTTGDFGAVLLDSFSGADDTAKLVNAMSAVGGDTYHRTIQLKNRSYTFDTTATRTAFDGLRIAGPQGYSNPERGAGADAACKIVLSGSGAFLTNPSGVDVFSVSLRDLVFVGGSSASILRQTGSNSWYCLEMKGIYSAGLLSVLGTQASKLLITAAEFWGPWEINNCYNGAFHLGGSDNALWTDGMLLDSGTAFNTAGSAVGQAHLWCDSLDKTYIGPLYITAEGGWRGIRHDGPTNPATAAATNQGYVVYDMLRLEGRNPGAPCDGALFKINGGIAELRSGWYAYGLEAPLGSELAPIHHAGGVLDVNGIVLDRYTGQAATVPMIYTIGSAAQQDLFVSRIKRGSRGGSWGTQRPVVARAVAGTENRITDASVALTTV